MSNSKDNIEDISLEEIKEILEALKEDGLIDVQIINGEPRYTINKLGESYFKHMESDPKTQN